jgi:hypothetical protein
MLAGQRIRETLRTRKCSYCKQAGHRINNCDHNNIQLFDELCRLKKTEIENMESLTISYEYSSRILTKGSTFLLWLTYFIINNPEQVENLKVYAVNKCNLRCDTSIERQIIYITNYIYDILDDINHENFIPIIMANNSWDRLTYRRSQINTNLILNIWGIAGFLESPLIKGNSIVYEGNNSEKECGVCLDSIKEKNFITFGCKHELCSGCMNNIMKFKSSYQYMNRCPFCRDQINKIQFYKETELTFPFKTS